MSDQKARRWECFSDAGYFDMWCVRRVGERTFGAGFHVINRESAEPLRDYLESLEAKLEKAREALRALAFPEFEKADGLADTQYVWETIYNDRVQDWFSYEEIEAARQALEQAR